MGATSNFMKIQPIINGDMGGNITSNNINVDGFKALGIQFVWSNGSTPVGTGAMQISNDNGVTWTSFGVSLSVTGNSGNGLVITSTGGDASPFSLVRALYVRSSGSGTLNAYLTAKND